MENSVQLVLNAEAEQPRPASFATGSKICLKPNVRLSPEMKACFQPLGVILPVNDWARILPSRTTNVSVAISYTLSAVSAVHRM